MKISKLNKLAWVFLALAATTTTLFAQGWRTENRPNKCLNDNCINQVSGITDEQKAKIDKLNGAHFEKMAELRKQNQSATDAIEKSEIRTAMLKSVKAHRDEVKSVLTPEQQSQFIAARGNGNGNNRQSGNGTHRYRHQKGGGNCNSAGCNANGRHKSGRGNGMRNGNCFSL